jgi:hypothetical protein
MTKLVFAADGSFRPVRCARWVASGMRVAVVMIAISASASIALAQGRVFYDGFEDGTTNKWGADTGHAKSQVVTQAVDGRGPRSGTRFMSSNFESNNYSGVKLDSWSYNREMFIRMWWRIDANFDNKDGAKLMRLGFSGSLDTETLFQRDGGSLHEPWYVSANLVKNCWSNHSLEDRNWHKLEIYIKHDTNGTDGIIKAWWDGQLNAGCYPFVGNTFGSQKWMPLFLPSNWSPNPGWEHDMNNNFYVDDVEVYSDMASGAIGSMVDATINITGTPPPPPTAPAAPTNLRVVQ